MTGEEEKISKIHIPTEDDTFFDKDHIVFYTDDSGEIKCRFGLNDTEMFQDLVMSVLSGSVNEEVLNFLIENLSEQNQTENALAIVVVRKLLQADDPTPIVKPSNFR